MLAWKPFTYEEAVYDLSHLHPFELEIVQEAKEEQPERIYCVDVAFSIHCFTVTPSSRHPEGQTLEYRDSRETRHFSFDRYELSKHLPEIMRGIGSRQCYHTSHGNYFIVEWTDGRTGQSVEYEVYFTVSKSGKRRGRLNLYVQSAYVRDSRPQRGKPKRRKPIRFRVIAYNTLQNRPIRPPQ